MVPEIPGRKPYKLTEAVIAGYCDLIRRHVPPRAAAAALGLAPNTVQQWLDRGQKGEAAYVQFVEAVEQAEAASIADLVGNIATAGEDPRQWKANAYLLGLKGIVPETRSVRVNVDATLQPDLPPETRDVIENGSDIEDEEVRACKASILRISRDLENARRDRSHVAIERYGRNLDDAQSKLRDARKRAQAGQQVRNLPEAELRDKLRTAAQQMPEPHLQVFAEEWLRRHRLTTIPAELAAEGGTSDP